MAGRGQNETEMQPMVDEAADWEDEHATQAKGPDWDRICAYKSFKVVRIKDRQLGFCYWGIVSAVVLYTMVFSLAIGGQHQLQELGIGVVFTQVFGKAYAGDKVFDPADYRFPVIEPNGAFIMTRQISVEQTKGVCVDWDMPKRVSLDKTCGPGEVVEGKYCAIATWCPSIGHQNAEKPPPEAEVDVLQGLGRLMLKIQAGISFPGITDKFFLAGSSPGGSNQFKNTTLAEVLNKTSPRQELDKKLLNHGALIGFSFFWNCDIKAECEPQVLIKRLDSGQGFVQKRAVHYRAAGVEKRKAVYINGIRLLIDSSGLGKKASLMLGMIQVGSAIALIRVAGIVADNIMLYSFHYTKLRRDAYYRCKVTETQDYSDLQDRINLIRDSTDRTSKSTATRGGAHADLSMGPLGRGGLASAIVKGRSLAS